VYNGANSDGQTEIPGRADRVTASASFPNRRVCPVCALGARQDGSKHVAFCINRFRIIRCADCGLLWTDVEPDFDAQGIYTRDYFEGGMSDGYSDYPGSEKILKAEFQARVSFVRSFKSSGRLFEIGCATGVFLQEAKPYFDVEGIDVSEFATTIARAKNLNVRCGEFHSTALMVGAYDVFILFDTIEHLPDPVGTVKRVRECLRPGGLMFITTGDSQSIVARLLGRYWRLLTPPQHLWFFGKRNITRLLSQLGFEVLAVRYPWRLVPLHLIWYQAFRGRMKAASSSFGSLAIPVNLFDSMMLVARRNG
jgi:SAM-dependent methyltransferase